MAQDDTFSTGDGTLEFLKVMGVAPAAEAQNTPEPAAEQPQELQTDDFATIVDFSTPSTTDQPAEGAPAPASAAPVSQTFDKPVVIKGGPRRISRADGRSPRLGTAMGQRHFEHKSGRAMFAPYPSNKLFNLVAPIAALAVICGGVVYAYAHSQAVSTEYAQEALIGTTGYDGALSLTPAKDGGYYTVFFVTSTPTNEATIGDLSQVVMYRTDKAVSGVTSATRIDMPADLYVTPYSAYSKNYYTLSETLKQTQDITRTLQAICDELDVRLYNVVCCDEEEYARINAYLDGSSNDASVFDKEDMLGRVRTNLSPESLKELCDGLRAVGTANMKTVTVPTTSLGAGDVVMERASADSYKQALSLALSNVKYDEHGYYYGTQYDENGVPILDEKGNPQGAVYTNYDANQLYFDADGYLVFYGQHYDDHGNPVGTQYDENGDALLDWNGNPQGTVYDDNGEPERDWLGNIVIQNG